MQIITTTKKYNPLIGREEMVTTEYKFDYKKTIAYQNKINKRDEPLEKLLNVLNSGRTEKGYKALSYAGLVSILKRVGKSKRGWDRNIFIANVLDAKNPGSYFWWAIKPHPQLF